MSVRMIGNDEHYGKIGFGSIEESAASTFSSAQLPAIAEPDLVIKTGTGSRRVLEIDIDDVLVWDNREWLVHANYAPDLVGGEGVVQKLTGGIVSDNTSAATDNPTADTIAEGTRPGGQAPRVVGAATATVLMAGDEVMPYVERFDFGKFGNEENAAGEVNINSMTDMPQNDLKNSPYEVDGVTCHYLMTAAHYWAWLAGIALPAASRLNIGADVRRMSIGVEELFFDRAVLLSILDALVLTN